MVPWAARLDCNVIEGMNTPTGSMCESEVTLLSHDTKKQSPRQ